MLIQPVLIAGEWRQAKKAGTFRAENPRTCQPLADEYPISAWDECNTALQAAHEASVALRSISPNRIAKFLENYADRIERRKEELVETAHQETALAISPRLAEVELPRTTNQLRQAAHAAREGSWSSPTIDSQANIRSYYASLGPVCVFGPNNFPFAFGSISGGDFASAIAAGNPVLAKANPSHPATTRLLAEEAAEAVRASELPPATVQLIYRISHEDGDRLVADPRVGAIAYTGSRSAGLHLKASADRAGKPIYLELSSVNPVIILPSALASRSAELAEEYVGGCLMGTGQFCTNPGMLILLSGSQTDSWIEGVSERFRIAPVGTLLSRAVAASLQHGVETLALAGAQVMVGNTPGGGEGYSFANTLLVTSGTQFLNTPAALQTEAFGNASLVVVAENIEQVCQVIDQLEGNLTGSIYSDSSGSEDTDSKQIAFHLRPKVGRMLNDKMPTGVAVSPAMNHGGPYPATSHPGFTAVGIPASMTRFAMLQCFDNIRPHRLPPALRDKNPNGTMWRMLDGRWSQSDVGSTGKEVAVSSQGNYSRSLP